MEKSIGQMTWFLPQIRDMKKWRNMRGKKKGELDIYKVNQVPCIDPI